MSERGRSNVKRFAILTPGSWSSNALVTCPTSSVSGAFDAVITFEQLSVSLFFICTKDRTCLGKPRLFHAYYYVCLFACRCLLSSTPELFQAALPMPAGRLFRTPRLRRL